MKDKFGGKIAVVTGGVTPTRSPESHSSKLGAMTTMNTIQGKTALVTGASRGIGRATALALADAGASVLVHYRSAAEEANAVVAHIRNAGGRAHALKADLGGADGPAVLTQNAREFLDGRLDILVLNAAISKPAPVERQTMQDFDNLFATNVRSPFFLVQQLLPLLGEGSNIIVISSIGAHAVVGKPGLDNASILAYAATKGALETLVKNWGVAAKKEMRKLQRQRRLPYP